MGISPRLVTLRASAILLGAGAWDVAPLELAVDNMDYMDLFFSYTRDGAAGAFDFRVEVSPYSADVAGVQSWFLPSVKDIGVFAAGTDNANAVQREGTVTYVATGAAIENFAYGLALSGSIERVRVGCCETGNVGAPGTVHAVGLLKRTVGE